MNKLIIHPEDRSTDFLKVIYDGRDDTTVITGGKTTEEVNEAIKSHDHIVMLGHGTPQGLLSVGKFNRKPVGTSRPSGVKSYSTYGGSAIDPKDLFDGDDFDYIPGWDNEVATARKPVVSTPKPVYKPVTTYSNYSNTIVDDNTAELLRDKKLTAIWCNADQYMEWNSLKGFYTGMFISEESEAKIIGTKFSDKWMVDESNYAFVTAMRKHLDSDAESALQAVKQEYGVLTERNPVARYNYMRLYANG